ncbi:MAG: hypothetical protein KF824_03990 [Fimbriimonadaceae bacterium]|nr:MAG: hypothetical protein KF824_03990 [Fimbriimonadaceae bacterium]
MKTSLKFLLWFVGIATILFFITGMPHIFRSAKSAARSSEAMSRLRSLSQANSLYMNYFDGVFMPASSMATVRALLQPYAPGKSSDINWQASENFSEPQFNFNLAGVSSENVLSPLGYKSVETDDILVFYVSDYEFNRIFGVDLGNKFLRYSESFSLNETDFLRHLSYQFDREGVKLFPPDYLAEQDPLKESK